MKKLTILLAIIASATLYSCTDETKEVIKEVKVSNLPDSLQIFMNDTSLVRKYKAFVADIKTGNWGTVPDFIVVSYGKNNNALNGQANTGLKRNHLSFQFFKGNTRYSFVTKEIKHFSTGDEYVSGAMSTQGIQFNPDFYNDNQFVYEIINL